MASIVLPFGLEINRYVTFLQSDWRVDVIIQSVAEPQIPDVPIIRFAVYIFILSIIIEGLFNPVKYWVLSYTIFSSIQSYIIYFIFKKNCYHEKHVKSLCRFPVYRSHEFQSDKPKFSSRLIKISVLSTRRALLNWTVIRSRHFYLPKHVCQIW